MSKLGNPVTGEDYPEAAKRHFTDAEFLFDAQRYGNATYLFGYVIECGLKSALVAYDADPWGHDLQSLSGQALKVATELDGPVDLDLSALPSAFITYQGRNWVSMRYLPDSAVTLSQAEDGRRLATQVFEATIAALTEEGLV